MKRYIISLISVILAVILDQYTKSLAVIHLKSNSVPIIDGVFELQYLENRGAAFGILQNRQWFFIVITIILLIAMTFLFVRLPQTKRGLPLQICIVFIISGAIGNLIDRIRLDYVIDFFYFKLIDFPIFNVADIFVSVSTVTIAYLILFFYSEEEFNGFFHSLSWKRKKIQE